MADLILNNVLTAERWATIMRAANAAFKANIPPDQRESLSIGTSGAIGGGRAVLIVIYDDKNYSLNEEKFKAALYQYPGLDIVFKKPIDVKVELFNHDDTLELMIPYHIRFMAPQARVSIDYFTPDVSRNKAIWIRIPRQLEQHEAVVAHLNAVFEPLRRRTKVNVVIEE